jgi:RNA polymerase sigma-70 factor (ECF subfamily)
MVHLMAERGLGSKAEAEDLTQEVFYRLFSKADTLRDPDSLRSFVYSFAIRTLKNELRRRKVRAWLSFDRPETIADCRSQSPNVESRDLLRRFHALLQRLSPRDRIVFILRRMEKMTVEEIAFHLNISESTVKRAMGHATSRLSRWIEDEPGLVDLLEPERW